MKKYVAGSWETDGTMYDVWQVDEGFARISFEASFQDYDEAEAYIEDREERDGALLAIFETTLM